MIMKSNMEWWFITNGKGYGKGYGKKPKKR